MTVGAIQPSECQYLFDIRGRECFQEDVGMCESTGNKAMIDIRCGDCVVEMSSMEEESIDLVVTSPPYASQRQYDCVPEEEYPDWFFSVGKAVHRVLKPTGSFVLNIKEHARDGQRSPYVIKTIFRLLQIFRWTDTFIWHKTNPFPTGSKRRLKDGFEYCFWFTKSEAYKFFPDNVLKKSTSKYIEGNRRRKNKGIHNTKNGSGMDMSIRTTSDMVRPSNVITLPTDTTNHEHPATFPVALPEFFIRLMTENGDSVLDPFCGSSSTGVACVRNNRNFIGIDISQKYVNLSKERLGAIDKQGTPKDGK